MNQGPQTIANLWAAEPAKGPRDCEFMLIATVGSSHTQVRSHKGLLVWRELNLVERPRQHGLQQVAIGLIESLGIRVESLRQGWVDPNGEFVKIQS